MNEPPPRSASLPLPSFSSLDSQRYEAIHFHDTHVQQHFPDLWNPIHETLLSQLSQIRILRVHLEDQAAFSVKQNNEIAILKTGKEEKERELEQSKEVNKEQRVQIGKQKAEFKEKEGELAACWRQREELELVVGVLNPQVSTLEREKKAAEASASANRIEMEKKIQDLEFELQGLRDRIPDTSSQEIEGLEKKIAELEVENKRVPVLEVKVEQLTLETRLLRKEKVTSDKELEVLKQEKKAYKLEKENLVKERDEAKGAEGLLLSKMQVLEAAKHTLDGKLVEQEGTIETRQREAESLARRLKNEREDFRDKSDRIQKEKVTLEEENDNLKRKINNIKAECSSGDADDEPPAKRPRTPHSSEEGQHSSGSKSNGRRFSRYTEKYVYVVAE
jgi:chromosome segregation ATPase